MLSLFLDRSREYRIGGLLGQGRYCDVYWAVCTQHSNWRKPVALKVLRDPRDEDLLQKEAQILGSLMHRNIPRTDGQILVQGRPALILEYVPGNTISEVVPAQWGRVPERVAVTIVAEVASALTNLHQTDYESPGVFVHCQVSPIHILLTPFGGVKLIGFGEARPASVGPCPSLKGEDAYCAPERRFAIRPASDIYSLGILLCRLLTGHVLHPPPADISEIHEVHGRAFAAVKGADLQASGALLQLVNSMLGEPDGTRPAASKVEIRCREILPRLGPPEPATGGPMVQLQDPNRLERGELSGLCIQDPPRLTFHQGFSRWWGLASWRTTDKGQPSLEGGEEET